MNARYYQGSRGQFMSQDPAHAAIGSPGFEQEYGRSLQSHLSNPQHLNSYSYAANNPMILVDQSGEIVVETALGLMLISTWALFNYNALQMQISDYEIETMTAYPTAYSPEQISAAQSSNERSALFSSATGGLISPSVGWIGIGVGYAGVASGAGFLLLAQTKARSTRKSSGQQSPASTVGTVLRGLGRIERLDPSIPIVCYQRERAGEL